MDPGTDFDNRSSERRCCVGRDYDNVVFDLLRGGIAEERRDLLRGLGPGPGLLMIIRSPI
jgi:hypothetical protein